MTNNEGKDENVMRLQRFLARGGVESRRAAEKLIVAGRVSVNGAVVTELGTKVDALCDEVRVDGELVALPEQATTIVLNKPAGYITAMKAQSPGDRIVAQLVPTDQFPGLYPIGRLDTDTTGVLLFSTDGNLGHELLHPSQHVPKEYVAKTSSPLSERDLQQLREGVDLEDGRTQPAQAEFVDDSHRVIRLVIREGRYHQVKKMVEAVGSSVVRLHRELFGGIGVDGLKPGQWRVLSEDEVAVLRQSGR